MCGLDSELFKARIEGTELNVCKRCLQFGTQLEQMARVHAPVKIVQKPEEEVQEVIVSNYSHLVKDRREALNLKQEDLAKRLSEKVSIIHKIETGAYKNRAINMLIAYGGRDDILHATKEIVKDAVSKKVKNINERLFRTYLISGGIPDIDLVIRTSGEERLSGFMPWQAGYSELYFSDKLWPDFTRRDLEDALKDYSDRQRRFGT